MWIVGKDRKNEKGFDFVNGFWMAMILVACLSGSNTEHKTSVSNRMEHIMSFISLRK